MRWMPLFALAPLAGRYVTTSNLEEQIVDQQDMDNDNYLDKKWDGTDCDDGNPDIHTDAEEICDGIDNNCDGTVDEDDAIDASTWYADTDGDGYGDNDAWIESCNLTDGYVIFGDDCDDDDPSLSPGVIEACDGIDNNCDGTIDEDCP